jgi:hypothetical protein
MRQERQDREARLREEVRRYGEVPLASVNATAQYLGGLNIKTIHRLLAKGALEGVNIGTRVMVRTDSARKIAGLTGK